MRIVATDEDGGKRLDVFLAERGGCSRAHAAKWIEEGRVVPAGKAGRRVAPGESFEVDVPEARPLSLIAEDIPLDILYEDADLLVLNKPAGLVVHPAAGNETGTLVQALLHHCGDLSGINGVIRPGIVHRLDKDTSGALVVAKNDAAHLRLQAQIQDREMARTYWALVRGRVKADEGRIEAAIGRDPRDRKRMAVTKDGRSAITRYRVLERMAAATLVECKLETGRTHQIRVHMRHIGHPVLGDPVYGTREERRMGARKTRGGGEVRDGGNTQNCGEARSDGYARSCGEARGDGYARDCGDVWNCWKEFGAMPANGEDASVMYTDRYGGDIPDGGPFHPSIAQMLHAVRLELTHPRTGERMRFLAMPPEAFWRRLKREGGDVAAARERLE